MKEKILCSRPGDVEIDETIVVVISPGGALDKPQGGQAAGRALFGKGSIAVVVVEAAVVGAGGVGLVAYEKIEPAIVVIISPGGNLGWGKREQARLFGYVIEDTSSKIAKE